MKSALDKMENLKDANLVYFEHSMGFFVASTAGNDVEDGGGWRSGAFCTAMR